MTDPLQVARQAAAAGGDIVRRYFEDGVAIRTKQSYNLVSDADIEAEQAIVERIRQSYPQHTMLAEEAHAGPSDAEHLWVVDPLDGTNNFAHRIPYFAISVAYYRRGCPVCGVVLNPIRDDWYVAQKDQGAWHNDRRLQVAENGALDEVLVGVGFYYDRGEMMEATLSAIGDLFREQIHGIRRFGTASLDLCLVAAGQFGAFFEYELSPWDFAAGRLIVEEAGGRVSTCQGAELPLQKTSLLATNGRLHETMLPIVSHHDPRAR